MGLMYVFQVVYLQEFNFTNKITQGKNKYEEVMTSREEKNVRRNTTKRSNKETIRLY